MQAIGLQWFGTYKPAFDKNILNSRIQENN